MKIKAIRATQIDLRPRPMTSPRVPKREDRNFHRPLSRYPELKTGCGADWKSVVCVATAEDGTFGAGFTGHGRAVQEVITGCLAPMLVGENCMATEKLQDVMRRGVASFSPTGLASFAISAVDVALWDLKGKLLGIPVYELLGGPQKQRIFCYASNTKYDYGLEESLKWYLELGFLAVKVFLAHGPEAGLEGLRRNEEQVARARDIVGDDVEVAVDAWMSLDVEYTVRLAEALKPYRIKWLEDYLLPEDLEQYARVRQRLPGVTLASGEHWYSTAPFAAAASRGLVDILQPDVSWCGGLTNAVKICHIAETHGLTAIAHAGMNYPWGQHLSYAMPAIAWGERSENVSPPGVPLEEMVKIPGTPIVKDGFVVPSDAPGFGMDIDLDWLESVTC